MKSYRPETWNMEKIYLNLQNVHQEPPVTQRFNFGMVDRGVFDGVPAIF